MVEVRLYGRLRRVAEHPEVTADSIAWVRVAGDTTVDAVLRRLGIDPEHEVSNIFINGRYFYDARVRAVRDGDRLGVFPKDMGMLYC